MQWADKPDQIKVRANADTPEDARIAVELGAEGIGLCPHGAYVLCAGPHLRHA